MGIAARSVRRDAADARGRATLAGLAAFGIVSLAGLSAPPDAFAVLRSCGPDALANTEDVLCAPPSGPCDAAMVTVGANIELTPAVCRFDLGGRALHVRRTLEVLASPATLSAIVVTNAGDVTVASTGKLKARGDAGVPAGATAAGGRIEVTSAGAISLAGLVDVTGDGGGLVKLTAGGDLSLESRSMLRAHGRGSVADQGERYADGGEIALRSLFGSVRIAGEASLRSENQGQGGQLEVSAARDVVVTRSIDVSGGASGGGFFVVSAGDDVTIGGTIEASSLTGGGDGGSIDVFAGDPRLPGVREGGAIRLHNVNLRAQGSQGEGEGGFGGSVDLDANGPIAVTGARAAIRVDAATNFDGSGGDVTIIGRKTDFAPGDDSDVVVEGVISARGGNAPGFGDGGEVDLGAGRNLVLSATVDVSGAGFAGALDVTAGGGALLNGIVKAGATSPVGTGGLITADAGVSSGGGLTVTKSLVVSGGSRSARVAVVTLTGCTLAIADRVTIDGRGGVDAGGARGGTAIALASLHPARLGARSRYLAGPGGSIVARHPPGADPLIGPGVQLDPALVDEPSLPPLFPACGPVACGNGVLEPGEQCDDGNLDDGDGCSSTCT
jgi:cysteine-rich repeat protein